MRSKTTHRHNNRYWRNTRVYLRPRWFLSIEPEFMTDDKPVLINGGTGEIFGPEDIIQLDPFCDPVPAAIAVLQSIKLRKWYGWILDISVRFGAEYWLENPDEAPRRGLTFPLWIADISRSGVPRRP